MGSEYVINPDVLKEVHLKTVIELLPLILTMAVLGIVGVIGNFVAIRFYGLQRRKTPTTFLIMSLAIVDLIVCILFVPNIAEMCLNVLYTSPIACKTMHFLANWSVKSSALILGFIACDRYLKICGEIRRKVTLTVAKSVVFTIVLFSCIMSVGHFITIDVIKVTIQSSDNDSDVGHYCTNTDDPDFKLIAFVLHIIDVLTVLAIFVTILVSYGNVILVLVRQKDIRNSIWNMNETRNAMFRNAIPLSKLQCTYGQSTGPNRADRTDLQHWKMSTQASRTNLACNTIEVPNISEDAEIYDDGPTCSTGTTDNTNTLTRIKSRRKKRNIQKSERSITILMLTVSVTFFLFLVPYSALRISLIFIERASDLELGLLTQFGMRLCYFNSVVNPLIYCLFNPSFRRHMKGI